MTEGLNGTEKMCRDPGVLQSHAFPTELSGQLRKLVRMLERENY